MTSATGTDPAGGPAAADEQALRTAFGHASRALGPSSGMFEAVVARRRRQRRRYGIGGVAVLAVVAVLLTTVVVANRQLGADGGVVTVVPASRAPTSMSVGGVELNWLPAGITVTTVGPWSDPASGERQLRIGLGPASGDGGTRFEVTVVWGVDPDLSRPPGADGRPVTERHPPAVGPPDPLVGAGRTSDVEFEPIEVAGKPAVSTRSVPGSQNYLQSATVYWATPEGYVVVTSSPADTDTVRRIADGVVTGPEPGLPADPAAAEAAVRAAVARAFDFRAAASEITSAVADGADLAPIMAVFQRRYGELASNISPIVSSVTFTGPTEAVAGGVLADSREVRVGELDGLSRNLDLTLRLTDTGWTISRATYCRAVQYLFSCPPT